jgi:hypothetical protein
MTQQQQSKQDPPPLKQRIEANMSDKIDFRLTAKTKDRLSNRIQDRFTNKSQSGNNIGAPINRATQQAYMPHINSWSDSRPQKKTGF